MSSQSKFINSCQTESINNCCQTKLKNNYCKTKVKNNCCQTESTNNCCKTKSTDNIQTESISKSTTISKSTVISKSISTSESILSHFKQKNVLFNGVDKINKGKSILIIFEKSFSNLAKEFYDLLKSEDKFLKVSFDKIICGNNYIDSEIYDTYVIFGIECPLHPFPPSNTVYFVSEVIEKVDCDFLVSDSSILIGNLLEDYEKKLYFYENKVDSYYYYKKKKESCIKSGDEDKDKLINGDKNNMEKDKDNIEEEKNKNNIEEENKNNVEEEKNKEELNKLKNNVITQSSNDNDTVGEDINDNDFHPTCLSNSNEFKKFFEKEEDVNFIMKQNIRGNFVKGKEVFCVIFTSVYYEKVADEIIKILTKLGKNCYKLFLKCVSYERLITIDTAECIILVDCPFVEYEHYGYNIITPFSLSAGLGGKWLCKHKRNLIKYEENDVDEKMSTDIVSRVERIGKIVQGKTFKGVGFGNMGSVEDMTIYEGKRGVASCYEDNKE